MELRHFRYFIAVAEELHFSRAAARLHVAQPALSRQIRDLEDELGLTLLERDRRSVALTPAGEALLAEGRKLFVQLEQAVNVARRTARGEQGTLSIGYVGSVAYSGLPQIVRSFRKRFPGVEVRFHEMSPVPQVNAILAGTLDVGFARGPLEVPGLGVTTVLDEPLVAALPRGHVLAARKELRLAQLAAEGFIVPARVRGPGFHDHLMTLCRQAGFSPRIVQEGSHFDVLSLVAAGCGVAIVPQSLCGVRRRDVVYRPLKERPRTQLVMAAREQGASPALREFLALVKVSGGLTAS
ncbi:MAG TPA: LysR family transcriptional regulator [Albitalea sp.]|nr:LysR family transcriptional regulator [Albitalea sp.]